MNRVFLPTLALLAALSPAFAAAPPPGGTARFATASAFARTLMEAIDVFEEHHYQPAGRARMAEWAVRGLYRQAGEKVPGPIEKRLAGAGKLSREELIDLLADARLALGRWKELEHHCDLTIALKTMLARLHPRSRYLRPDEVEPFSFGDDRVLRGIGLLLGPDQGGYVRIVTPLRDSPAYRAGLRAGDRITHIASDTDQEGNPLPRPRVTATKGLTPARAEKLLLGQVDTKVTLTVLREGKEKPFEVEVTRGVVGAESVLGFQRKDDDGWDYLIDRKNKIGYIRLTSFARHSDRDLEKAMAELTRQGVKGLVLDLRFNPGGLLDRTIHTADLFLDDGVILTIKPRVGREARFVGNKEGSLLGFPMVCLVNGGSARGSEVVAAALQDHGRALILGKRTMGQGYVQNIAEFTLGPHCVGELRLTTAVFLRPKGQSLDRYAGSTPETWGVRPDKLIELSASERAGLADHLAAVQAIHHPERRARARSAFKDRQLEAALEHLRAQSKMASRKAG